MAIQRRALAPESRAEGRSSKISIELLFPQVRDDLSRSMLNITQICSFLGGSWIQSNCSTWRRRLIVGRDSGTPSSTPRKARTQTLVDQSSHLPWLAPQRIAVQFPLTCRPGIHKQHGGTRTVYGVVALAKGTDQHQGVLSPELKAPILRRNNLKTNPVQDSQRTHQCGSLKYWASRQYRRASQPKRPPAEPTASRRSD